MRISIVAGGAGFIGANLISKLMNERSNNKLRNV